MGDFGRVTIVVERKRRKCRETKAGKLDIDRD
jgi:hypothetical protein